LTLGRWGSVIDTLTTTDNFAQRYPPRLKNWLSTPNNWVKIAASFGAAGSAGSDAIAAFFGAFADLRPEMNEALPEQAPFLRNRNLLSTLVFGRVFCGEPLRTSPENALAASWYCAPRA
jgi:hypothetical protein